MTIGVRAANFVTKELKIPSLKRTIWTDSTCVLYWLTTDKPLSLFVENRVKEIQRQNDSFFYVPSSENPADLPTRGLTVSEIENSRLWWQGPNWLASSHDIWPKWQPPQPVLRDMQLETRAPRVLYECSNIVNHGEQEGLFVCRLDEKKYSSLRKLLRVTCYCLKFVKKQLWDLLSESSKAAFKKKHVLLAEVFNSLSDGHFVYANDITLAMLMWTYVSCSTE